MEEGLYQEMVENLEREMEGNRLQDKDVFLFGHCEATLLLLKELEKRGIRPIAILDNSAKKQGMVCCETPIWPPVRILERNIKGSIVLLVTRFGEAMSTQLQRMGFRGKIKKLVDFNSYAEYSLSEQTIAGKRTRCASGESIFQALEKDYPDAFFIFCPFPALGDVYYAMAYLPDFCRRRGAGRAVVCVSNPSCAEVAELFGKTAVTLAQKDLDAVIQAVLFYRHGNAFIAHQDRPYVINLHCALYEKRISMEQIYKQGIFGLGREAEPVLPTAWKEYAGAEELETGHCAILSPYAKSVIPLPAGTWEEIVSDLNGKGYQLFTNVADEEVPLAGTEAIRPKIAELKSVVEKAGLFIGIRSGLCDVLRSADCRKIALYPDYCYGDTRWKAIEMYALGEFENYVVTEGKAWHVPQ